MDVELVVILGVASLIILFLTLSTLVQRLLYCHQQRKNKIKKNNRESPVQPNSAVDLIQWPATNVPGVTIILPGETQAQPVSVFNPSGRNSHPLLGGTGGNVSSSNGVKNKGSGGGGLYEGGSQGVHNPGFESIEMTEF